MKILITGGAGFIGSHLADYHLKQKDSVWVVDDLSTGSRDNIEPLIHHPHFRFTKADIISWDELEPAVAWADAVYHLAAIVGQVVVIAHPVSVLTKNIDGCKRILKTVAQKKPSCKVLIASSSEVYGPEGTSTFKEDAPLTFPSGECVQVNYSLSKFVNELTGLSYVQEHGIHCVIARLFNTTGPHQTGRYGMVVPRFVEQAVAGKPITVYGEGNQTRSFCDIRDTCRLLHILLQDPGSKGEIFNVGNDREISILDLAKLVKKEVKSSSEIVQIPYQEAYGMAFKDTLRRRPDLKKVKERYHYQPEFTLEMTIQTMMKQMRQPQTS